MNGKDHKPEQIFPSGPQAETEHGLIGHWISRFFPVWSDTPPYDRAPVSRMNSVAASAAKR
jgi:hypothetical protein